MKKSDKLRLINYERSTTWLQFYIYFRFPLGFIFGGLTLLYSIISPIVYQTKFDWLTFILFAAIYIFSIWVFCEADSLKPIGYKLLHIMLPIEVLFTSADSIYAYEFGIKFVLISLIWWLPNAIYFKKRKSLFYEKPPVIRFSEKYGTKENDNKISENNTEQSASEQLKIQSEVTPKDKGNIMIQPEKSTENDFNVCKKCGDKLPANATFCSKCGKRVCKKERKPLTKRKKIVLFTGCLLLCICAITGSGIIGYHYGKSSGYFSGYNIGYSSGYDEGKEVGIDTGHYRGYKQGYDDGKKLQLNTSENTSKITNDPRRQALLDKSQTTNKNQIRKCATPGCDEISTSSKNFCSLHKCKYNSCENERYLDCEYCRRHKCKDALCHEPRANDNTEFCTIHKCHAPKCNLQASYNSLYCTTHKNMNED